MLCNLDGLLGTWLGLHIEVLIKLLLHVNVCIEQQTTTQVIILSGRQSPAL
jgi:hypothetical protein